MKINLFYFLGVYMIFLAPGVLSCKGPSVPAADDEATIHKMMTEGMTTAWEKGDRLWIEANYLEDADIGFPSGPIFAGRKNLPVSGGIIPKGRKFHAEIQNLKFISPEVAIVNNNAHFTGGVDAKGAVVPDSRDAGTFILKKEGGQWKIAALRVLPMRVDLEKAKADISKALDAFATAWKNGNAAESANLFTEDAINYRPDAEPDHGRAAILKMSEGWMQNNIIKELKFTTLELDILGDQAFELGTFIQHIAPKNGSKSMMQQGRYFATWRFDADGQWRIDRFMFNNSPASH